VVEGVVLADELGPVELLTLPFFALRVVRKDLVGRRRTGGIAVVRAVDALGRVVGLLKSSKVSRSGYRCKEDEPKGRYIPDQNCILCSRPV